MANIPTSYEQKRQMSIDPRRFSRFTGKPLPKYYSGVAPFGLGGAGAVMSSKVGGLFGKVKTAVSRQFLNPFAGTTIKQGLSTTGKNILGKGLTYGLGYEAFQLSKSGITGERFDPIPNAKIALGLALNPFAGFGGILAGEAKKTYKVIESGIKGKDFTSSIPQIPSMPSATNVFNFPESPQATGGLMPSASYTAPSVSISGGGGGIPPELLLLLVGGALGGGYVLGKRKRKKKKSKKRRSVKK